MIRIGVPPLVITLFALLIASASAHAAEDVTLPERNPNLTADAKSELKSDAAAEEPSKSDDSKSDDSKTGDSKTGEVKSSDAEASGDAKDAGDAEATAEDDSKSDAPETESAADDSDDADTESAAGSLPIRNPRLTENSEDAKQTETAPVAGSDKPKGNGPDYAALLDPILHYKLSSSDIDHLKDAISSAYHDKGDEAKRAIERLQDPSAKELALWYAYRSDDPPADARTIEAFRESHPHWPSLDDLRAAAERKLFMAEADANEVTAFFKDSAPETGAGKAALATAYTTVGDKEKAKLMVRSAWREHPLDKKVEEKILADFGKLLSDEDHRARIDMLMYPDDSTLVDEAERVAKLLPDKDQKKIEARIAVQKRRSNAGKLLDALPDDADAKDVGLLFNRIQYLRRNDKEDEALKLMLSVPDDPARLGDLDQWWIERRVNCRMALRLGEYEAAYKIASNHGPIKEKEYLAEAEFLAGWIALRFLGKPKEALPHFALLRTTADDSKTQSRAEYWMGRTAQALGDRRTAIIHFAAAARYPQHYYGQLGRQALDAAPAKLEVTPTPVPSKADVDRFTSRHAVRAIGVAMASDYEALMPYFFISLARSLESPAEVVLLAELARQSGNRQISIRLAKIAFNRDMPVGEYALPIGVIPNFVRLSDKVDVALVHALSRQESEFNAGAKSPVGAQGLMQLMPSTARLVAKQFNVKYSAARLTEPAYNVQLGEAHLGDLISNYDGSYFLALVAYNAGPGRVKQWVEAFGDPRDPDVDPIDWVESIPFTETREYVIKIMESLQLYRSRLHGTEKALQLWQDLNRGRAQAAATPPEPPGAAELRRQASSE
ncbi:Soluble lytic murein transglycosylase precursor [Methyloligella halotolerans]|uniref:Soluble lytic murein transglycosylase n=1 Tax=Methyloligella halotolerans TaxID=1177755 RepID=A0A1E2S2A4_9HYPH|nr:lytic transglycosylase domain-containing protein [Methyloligella halotolerans]ODA68607.1 Soluble lytic murein transglycosylase precursor [Methyloligella halotolerans]